MSETDFDAVLRVARAYYDAMLYGNAGSLANIFEPDARFQGLRDAEQIRRGLPEFIAMVSAPDAPRPRQEDYSVAVELIDVTGPVAIVKVRDRFRGRNYLDYLTLVKTGPDWRIVNKAFTTVT